ncbi:MAG TPA: hypothetical protein VIF62_31990 [Labilithrix sp.]
MYRIDGQPKDLELDPDEIARAQSRRKKKTFLALGVVVVVLGAAGAGAAIVVQRKSRAATRTAWNELATCLVGDPLAAGEKASARVRNEQLTAMSETQDKRDQEGADAWPLRCASRAHAVAETVRSGGGSDAFADSSEKLAKALSAQGATSADLGALVDKVFADAHDPHARASNIAAPPEAAAPMTLATLPKDARLFGAQLTLEALHFSPFGDATLRFVVDEKDFAKGPHVCSLAAGAKEIACKKVPEPAAKLSPGLRLWGTTTEGASPLLFAGDRGKSGIFRSDTGALVADKLEYGAYGANAFPDGSVVWLGWHEPPAETRVFRVGTDGKKKETLLVARKESGNPYYSSAIFWDTAAYKAVGKGVDGIRLRLRTIAPSGEVGPVVDVGRIDEVGHIDGGQNEEPHLTACRVADTMLIRAKGWDNTYLSFFAGGKWTAPVEASGTGGTLQCRTGEAVISRVVGGVINGRFRGGVRETRCTVSGCTDHELEMKKTFAENLDVLPREAKDIRSVDLEGKRLVVWSAGERGGIRMRLAPIDQVATTPDKIVIDDHVQDGAFRVESSIVDFQLVPIQGGALLLVSAIDGVYVWRIDPSGKMDPVATRA